MTDKGIFIPAIRIMEVPARTRSTARKEFLITADSVKASNTKTIPSPDAVIKFNRKYPPIEIGQLLMQGEPPSSFMPELTGAVKRLLTG